jgi:hypothetical protein
MTDEKWHYLKRQAEKHKARFLRCDGVVYEATKTNYPTGLSPLWSIEAIRLLDVPGFVPEPADTEKGGDQ